MKLIVGLGNIGTSYNNTRHNIGFIALDNVLKRFVGNNNIVWQEKFNGEIFSIKINNETFVFVKPSTYMNLSGNCVGPLMQYYQLLPQDLVIVQDDLDQPLGDYKIKVSGSDGGHNGIKDIVNKLNINNFVRFKIGVGRPTIKSIDIPSFLTTIKFTNEELKKINPIINKLFDFINLLSQQSLEIAISKTNRR